MIWVIAYIAIALFMAFITVAYNEATIKKKSDRDEANVDAFSIALFWPIPFVILVVITPFWAVSSLAKWFGRNYL